MFMFKYDMSKISLRSICKKNHFPFSYCKNGFFLQCSSHYNLKLYLVIQIWCFSAKKTQCLRGVGLPSPKHL